MVRRVPSRGEIVRCLVEGNRGLHAREIASRLDVAEGSYRGLLELLDRLTLDGVIVRLAGNRFKARGALAESWEGALAMHPRGFGFVSAAGRDDVFIAPDGVGSAMHGDRVVVTVIGRTSRGLEGRVDDVVARRQPRVSGVLRRRGRSAWLEPDDVRIRGPIVLGKDVTEGRDGEAAVAEIRQFPSLPEENPEGVLIEVLGLPGDPRTEVRKVLVREAVEEEHPPHLVDEADAAVSRVRVSAEGRRDLRDVPLPTIDPEDARDHDDAVWVERTDGGYRAYVAIADVSEYVPPGSALDVEAERRGFTIYLPDRAVPMLPASLASGACSLVPHADRLCLCVIAELDRSGALLSFELVEGVMRSAAALTYGGVARALGWIDDGKKSRGAELLRPGLAVIDELAQKLRAARFRRGALDLDLPEAQVLLGDEGAPEDVIRRTEQPGIKRAYQMIEELMLLANEIVARFVEEHGSPTVYRVHAPPDEAKLERLAEVCGPLGVQVQIDGLLEYGGVGRWLRSIADHPRSEVLSMLLLRSLKQASYSVENIGHFGLASEAYLHFTSPIRRYPDLVVHRGVKAILHARRRRRPEAEAETLQETATQSSARERAVAEIEREVVDLYRAILMQERLGEVYEGTVSGLVGSGVFVALDAPFVDVLVRAEDLGSDQFELSDDELAMIGVRSGERVSLGDRMRLRISDVAVLRRTVYAQRVTESAGRRTRHPERTGTRTQRRESRREGRPAGEGPRRAVTGTGARRKGAHGPSKRQNAGGPKRKPGKRGR